MGAAGRRWAAGPLNVLMFAHAAAAREAVELTSRIDSRVDLILSSGNGGFDTWADDRLGDQGGFYAAVPSKQALNDRTAAFLSPAYKHDAIIIGRLMWTIIPENFRQQILAKVKAGTALVFVSPWEVEKTLLETLRMTNETPLAATIRQSVPLAMLPLDLTIKARPGTRDKVKTMGPFEVSAGRLGEGRVVFLQYNDFHHYPVLKAGEEPPGVWQRGAGGNRPLRVANNGREENSLTPLPDFVGNDPLFHEYYFSILGKALLHAAGREPAVRIQPEAVTVALPRQNLPATPVAFKLTGTLRPGMELHYEIRDRANQVIARGRREAGTDAATPLKPEFPVVRSGLYVVDAWLKRGGLTVDWASAAVTVTGPKYLESVVPDKEFFDRTEGIRGRVNLVTAPPAGHKVVVALWDTHGRLEQRLDLASGATTFRFAPITHPLSRAYRIEASVRDGEAVVDLQERWAGLPSSEVEGFQFVVWDAALGGRAAQVRMQLHKEHGLTGYFDMAPYLGRGALMQSADLLVQNNLTAWPLCNHIGGCSPKQSPDLLTDPWKERFRKFYTDRTDAYGRYGTLAYGIDSESDFDPEESGWDLPAGRENFRNYLKKRYGDLAALNKVWGTSFASFEDIGFVSLMKAKTARQPTRWMEQQLFKRDRFNDTAKFFAKLVRELVPGARVSHDIAVVPAKPSWDMPRMTGVIDAFIQSDMEHFDKRNKQRLGSAAWFGSYENETGEWQMRTKPWESLFQGGKAIAWWTGQYSFTSDLSAPLLYTKQASEEIREIRAGADQLLMAADKRVDPILILWSWESWMAAIYNPLETDWSNSVNGFINLFRRTGLEYQCVGEDFLLEKLRFGPDQRVLVLPASQCLSRAAVQKIRAFAAAGGIVMADYLPATMDEYLRPYGASSAKPAGEVKFETCPKCKGKKIIHLGGAGDPLGNCPVCGGIGSVAKGGNLALDKSILDDVFDFTKMGIKPVGKGYGVFFMGAPPRDEWRALRTLMVEKGGVRGDLEVLDILGNTRTDLRTYVYDSGPALFVGVLPDKTVPDPPGEEFLLKTAKPMHAYNVRTHAYLGQSTAITAGILSTQPKLFALLPERIEGLAVTADKTTRRPGEAVLLDIKSLPEPLKDVSLAVRVEVLKDGKVIEAHTKNITVKATARHPIAFALNQEPGEYTVRLTEVISGQRQEVNIRVEAQP